MLRTKTLRSAREEMDAEIASCRPLLRWAGSKLKLIGELEKYWLPRHTRYIEPFAGSACLFFHLAPTKAILGDYNSGLIEMYEVVRQDADRIARRLSRIPRTAETYYRWRSKDIASLGAEERALRFLYLNRHCFNGIFRTNDLGAFNVPFGTRLGARLPAADIRECGRRLSGATLISGDFERTLAHARKGDLVYMDPPFAMARVRNRRQYGAHGFDSTDLDRLDNALHALNSVGADFIVSYGDCSEARGLASNWLTRRVRVRRHVAGFAEKRGVAYELMISNFALPGKG